MYLCEAFIEKVFSCNDLPYTVVQFDRPCSQKLEGSLSLKVIDIHYLQDSINFEIRVKSFEVKVTYFTAALYLPSQS